MRTIWIVLTLAACGSPPASEPPPRKLTAKDFKFVHTPDPAWKQAERARQEQWYEQQKRMVGKARPYRSAQAPKPASPPDCPEKPAPLTEEELQQRSEAVAWVREHCHPQSYPVMECESRCRPGLHRTRCEADCQAFQVYAHCPMVECPDSTEREWISWYYEVECPGRRALLVEDERCP